jgi:hypothetical protein
VTLASAVGALVIAGAFLVVGLAGFGNGLVALEWLGVYPERLSGQGCALGAGLAAGLLADAIGTPGPPVVLYMASQGLVAAHHGRAF